MGLGAILGSREHRSQGSAQWSPISHLSLFESGSNEMKVTSIWLPQGWAGWTRDFVWEEGWGSKAHKRASGCSPSERCWEGEKRANKRKHQVIKISNQAETWINCARTHRGTQAEKKAEKMTG